MGGSIASRLALCVQRLPLKHSEYSISIIVYWGNEVDPWWEGFTHIKGRLYF